MRLGGGEAMVERRWRSNSGELPRRSAVARGAPVAPCEREGCEGRLQLKEALSDGSSHRGWGENTVVRWREKRGEAR
jgi:hypothetical protein